MHPTLSRFAQSLNTETAFDVLAVARRLKAQGKDVIELQIGDSPFPTPAHARALRALAGEGGWLFAQSTISPEPTTTCPSSRTRMGTLRWPLNRSISARSRARLGHVQSLSVPPFTFFHSYVWPVSSSALAALPHGWAIGAGSPPSDLPSVQV